MALPFTSHLTIVDFSGPLTFQFQPLLLNNCQVFGSSFIQILERENLIDSTHLCHWALSLWGTRVWMHWSCLGQVDFQGQPLSASHKDEPVLLLRRSSGLGPLLGLSSMHYAKDAALETPRELYGRAKAGRGVGSQQWLLKLKKKLKCSTCTMIEKSRCVGKVGEEQVFRVWNKVDACGELASFIASSKEDHDTNDQILLQLLLILLANTYAMPDTVLFYIR